MFALELDLPPKVRTLARRLWAEPGAVLLGALDGSGPSYLSCWPTESRDGLDPEPALPWGTTDRRDTRLTAPRWVGILPYEAQRARMERPAFARPETRSAPHHETCRWWRYPAFVRIDRRVSIVGDDPSAVSELTKRLRARGEPAAPRARIRHAPEQEPGELHRARIQAALELIRAGEIYQVNLSRRIELAVEGSCLALLERLARRAPSAYAFAFEPAGVVSTSPELCLRTTTSRRALTVPIKGTRPRGRDAVSDGALARELEADEKERAELSMVIDIERNDLGRVAAVASVVARPPAVVSHKSLFHRQAIVCAGIRSDVDRESLLRAFMPSGSVTGAPKVRAMELIAELESCRRGLYTGAYGVLAHDGTLELAMAIRTLTVRGDEGHYAVGGGIVLGSDADREVMETQWKAVQLAND